jgi:hypothetical protein
VADSVSANSFSVDLVDLWVSVSSNSFSVDLVDLVSADGFSLDSVVFGGYCIGVS